MTFLQVVPGLGPIVPARSSALRTTILRRLVPSPAFGQGGGRLGAGDVADGAGDLADLTLAFDSRDTKLCRISRGVSRRRSDPRQRRNPRRTSAGSNGVPVAEAKTRSWSPHRSTPLPPTVRTRIVRPWYRLWVVGRTNPPESDRCRYRTLPEALRRQASAAVLVCAFILAALGVRYAGNSAPRWLDDWALTVVPTVLPVRASLGRSVIALADPIPLAVLTIALCVACLVAGRRSLALLAAVGPLMTVLATIALKPLVDRTKDGDLAYPSGHASVATALALVAGLLLVSVVRLPPLAAAAAMVVVALPVSVGMGVAMVAANYHYATDVVGGFCAAVSVVLGLALLMDRALSAGFGPP
jgi:membrane-associated phospholipid phosphatase